MAALRIGHSDFIILQPLGPSEGRGAAAKMRCWSAVRKQQQAFDSTTREGNGCVVRKAPGGPGDRADMAIQLLTKIFGSRNDRLLKQYRKTVERINALAPGLEGLSDDALKAKTQEFRERLASGTELDALLPEAFAVVREASTRVMKMRHFDVQMVGGIALHNGKIAEMRTGEGKTLTATLPVYLNALTARACTS